MEGLSRAMLGYQGASRGSTMALGLNPPPGSIPALLPQGKAVGVRTLCARLHQTTGHILGTNEASKLSKSARNNSTTPTPQGQVRWGTPPHVGVLSTTGPLPRPGLAAMWGISTYPPPQPLALGLWAYRACMGMYWEDLSRAIPRNPQLPMGRLWP